VNGRRQAPPDSTGGLLAGIDVGTTNTKVGMYTPTGIPVAQRKRPTPVDADDIVADALRDLGSCMEQAGAPPIAVGITGMAEGGVGLDAELRPLHRFLRWSQPPAVDEARWLAHHVGAAALWRTTGVNLAAKTPLATWLWLRGNRPDTVARMRVWVGAADLVATALCGRPLTDQTLAGRSGAFDQLSGRYDEDLLSLAGIRIAQLPEVDPVGSATDGLLPGGTPVVVTGHDHLVAAYAAGARGHGDVADSMGTAEAVVTVTDQPCDASVSGSGSSWNRHVDGRHWVMVSGFPGSGQLVDWTSALLANPEVDRRPGYLADPTTARPTGIIVLPYLYGRAAPAPQGDLRLSVHGLTADTGPADIAVAVLEGACYQARWMAETHASHGNAALDSVYVLGGPTRNRTWMAIKADVMPCPIRLIRTAEAACAGAALLAGRAIGLCTPVLDADEPARDGDRAQRYEALYRGSFLPKVT